MTKPVFKVDISTDSVSSLEAHRPLALTPDDACFHSANNLRMPLGIYNVSVTRVCDKLVRLCQRLETYFRTSRASTFPIHGFFFTPLHSSFEAKEPGVFYLGHVNATVRERQGNEFKAGPSVPLIDQAVAGASGGTFDVEITDQWSTDEAAFLSKFPVLTGISVQKALLPAFDRTKAQQWWEAN